MHTSLEIVPVNVPPGDDQHFCVECIQEQFFPTPTGIFRNRPGRWEPYLTLDQARHGPVDELLLEELTEELVSDF